MAIFTRFGSEIELVAYCGKQLPYGCKNGNPMMLVRARFKEDGLERHQFVWTLKADGGLEEIEEVIDSLPEITLTGKLLKDALREAE